LSDQGNHGLDKIGVIKQGEHVGCAEDSRRVQGMLHGRAKVFPGRAVEKEVGTGLSGGSTRVARRGGDQPAAEFVGVERGEVSAELRENVDIPASSRGRIRRP
jgi:hypothetical protein